MDEVLKILIEKLPVKFVAAVLIVVMTWFGLLTVVALTTNRSVEFFPPHIGLDKTLISEVQTLSSQINRLEQNEQKHRDKLLELLAKAREESIYLQRTISYGTTDASISVSKYEDALRGENERYLSQIQELKKKVESLSAKF